MPSGPRGQIGKRTAEEVEVLKNKKNADVRDHAECDQQFSDEATAITGERKRHQKVDRREQEDQNQKLRIPERIEVIARNQEKPDRHALACQQAIDKENDREKYEVIGSGEEHRVSYVRTSSKERPSINPGSSERELSIGFGLRISGAATGLVKENRTSGLGSISN